MAHRQPGRGIWVDWVKRPQPQSVRLWRPGLNDGSVSSAGQGRSHRIISYSQRACAALNRKEHPQAPSSVPASLDQPLAELACTRFGWCAKLRPTRACRVGSGPESMDVGAGVSGPRGREQPVWLCASRHLGRHGVLSRPAAHAMHSCPPPTHLQQCRVLFSGELKGGAIRWNRIIHDLDGHLHTGGAAAR